MKRCKEIEISLHKVYTLFIYRICCTQLNHGGKGKVNSANSQTFRCLFVIVLPYLMLKSSRLYFFKVGK